MAQEQTSNVVVFDLDETIGYFTEFGIFYDSLVKYLNAGQINREWIFAKTLQLFPEVIRPNLFSVLTYLKKKKQDGMCSKVLIYTNNQGPRDWAHMIKRYIHKKLDYILFDSIIGAFKVRGKIEEVCRTSNEKSTTDLVRCAKLPKETRICFIDDIYHENMDNVYYIKVTPYIHTISMNVMVNRFLDSTVSHRLGIKVDTQNRYIHYMRAKIHEYKYTYVVKEARSYDIDKIVTKQIMVLLQNFFH